MIDYKNTLNLPKTDFPMKANLTQREPAMLTKWEEMKLYQALRKTRHQAKKYILHDGPPYANGDIHLGHVINKTLKDFTIKAKALSGYDTPFTPGWDCHGLPIDLKVEKEVGKAGVKLSHEEFRRACRQYAEKQVNKQKASFKRLGILGDWEHPYLTMDSSYEANILRSLAKIIENGYIYRGFKPVHWCVDCGSALAEAEVEYQDKRSLAVDVRFAVENEALVFEKCHHTKEDFGAGGMFIPIWTTTVWTLPANQAVAVHPKLNYAVVDCLTPRGRERLIIAEALLKDAMMRYNIDDYRVVAYCEGSALEGIKLQHPFYHRTVSVVLSDHVTTDAGTGAVHIAPGHGQEDYVVGQRYDLSVHNPVDAHGYFLPNTVLVGGLPLLSAQEKILETLRARGMLLAEAAITHSYPHCWRHKTPLIFRATPQWFVGLAKNNLREKVMEAIESANWIPDWGKARINGMVMNRPDWCISRQRTWGTPIAVFIHHETGELHPDSVRLMRKIADRVEKEGLEVWDHIQPSDLLGADAASYVKVNDILDVWFEAGVSHFCVLKQFSGLHYPADLYIEAHDQYRGWFQSAIITACAMGESVPPCKEVFVHGFVLDAQGIKMSKSQGNIIPPEKIINVYGADMLRLWASSRDTSHDMTLSEEILTRLADAYRRIRNTARFLFGNLVGFDPIKDGVAPEKMLALDRWAVDSARLLQIEIREAYDQYQFHLIYQKIHNFCSKEMGSFYLDVIKDRQYTTKVDSLARRSAQTAMYHIIEALTRWIAPILSFTADEIWPFIPGNRASSVFLSTWYEKLEALSNDESMNQAYWRKMMAVRDEVNKEIERLRVAGKLGSALEAEVTLYADDALKADLDQLGDELRFVLITSSAQVETLDTALVMQAMHGGCGGCAGGCHGNIIETEVSGLKLHVAPSAHPKCIRCWHRRPEIGDDLTHPALCARCIQNVSEGKGEARRFA
jgi:isoleucyl-tRNA synthetase